MQIQKNTKIFAFIITTLLVVAVYLIWHFFFYQANRRPNLGITKHQEGGYTFMVDGEPYIVRGVCYNPIPVGEDYEYDFWTDPSKPWLTDGKLMKKMGVNSIRIYRVGENDKAVKAVLRDFHRKYGISSYIGNYLGFWDWPPANYSNPRFRQTMIQEVLDMVELYKDEPSIMGWILGNENNYSFDRNVRPWSSAEIDKLEDPKARWAKKGEIYYTFVNDLAQAVKKIDPTRPVIMGVGEAKSLELAAKYTPDIDILGAIVYRGATFGNFFRVVKQQYDKPVLLIEYGADRFNAYTKEEDEASQARFVELQWRDIERNSTLKTPKGNVIGGMLFEWTDEWWKANENLAHTWAIHDKTAQWSNSSYYYDYEVAGNMNINEEWWGIVGLKPKPKSMAQGSDKRIPKKAYHVLKNLWTNH